MNSYFLLAGMVLLPSVLTAAAGCFAKKLSNKLASALRIIFVVLSAALAVSISSIVVYHLKFVAGSVNITFNGVLANIGWLVEFVSMAFMIYVIYRALLASDRLAVAWSAFILAVLIVMQVFINVKPSEPQIIIDIYSVAVYLFVHILCLVFLAHSGAGFTQGLLISAGLAGSCVSNDVLWAASFLSAALVGAVALKYSRTFGEKGNRYVNRRLGPFGHAEGRSLVETDNEIADIVQPGAKDSGAAGSGITGSGAADSGAMNSKDRVRSRFLGAEKFEAETIGPLSGVLLITACAAALHFTTGTTAIGTLSMAALSVGTLPVYVFYATRIVFTLAIGIFMYGLFSLTYVRLK